MLKKISLPVLLTVMCALLLVVVLLYGFNTGKFTFLQKKAGNQNLVQTEEEEKIKRTDYTEVARKTLDWIDKQRNEEGWYILERGCHKDIRQDCDVAYDDKNIGNKDGLIIIWSRLNFFEQHKNPKDLEIAKSDLKIFLNHFKNQDLGDSLWLCKIAYFLIQNNNLNEETRNQIKEICLNIKVIKPEEIDSQRVKLMELKGQNNIETMNFNNWNNYVMRRRTYDAYFGSASDYLFRYLINNDKNDFDLSKNYFDKLKELVDKELPISQENLCIVGNSALDLYEFGEKNKDYLSFSVDIVENRILGKSETSYNTPICGLFVKKLFQITREQKYLSILEINNKSIISNFFDEKQTDSVGYGGFFESNLGVFYSTNKNLVENGVLVELLRD